LRENGGGGSGGPGPGNYNVDGGMKNSKGGFTIGGKKWEKEREGPGPG
jgi:hypothetical protein